MNKLKNRKARRQARRAARKRAKELRRQTGVKLSYSSKEQPLPQRLLIQAIEFATGRAKMERIHDEIWDMNLPPKEEWQAALQKLNIQARFDANQLAKIPENKQLVFVANHPFGVVDGLLLGYLMAEVREHFMVLVNSVLCQGKVFSNHFLPISFDETQEALKMNIDTRRKVLQRMAKGEALAIFPAGGVSTSPKIWGKAQDLEWKRFVGKVIQKAKATVVPIFFHGQNSRLFQVASHVSSHLRLSLLINEVKNKMGKTIDIEIGNPIPYQEIESLGRQELLDFLRQQTFALANQDNEDKIFLEEE